MENNENQIKPVPIQVEEENEVSRKQDSQNSNSAKNDVFQYQGMDAFVLYFFSRDSMNCVLKKVPGINPTLQLRKSNESFALREPAFFLNGTPVFMVIRNYPVSIKMEFLEAIMMEKGYSSSEIDAIINSVHINSFFRKGLLNTSQYLLIALSNVLSIVSTYLFCQLTMGVAPV